MGIESKTLVYMFRKNFPNLCLVSFKWLPHLLLLEWETVRSPVYSSWLCLFLSESETAWSCQQAQRRDCMDFRLPSWTVGAALWYCPYAAEGCPKTSSCRKCVLSLVYPDKERSAEAAQSQLRCLCTTCPLAFRYSVFLPMEPLVLSHWGIWVLHNPVLEWLLAGHLDGWHHFCAGLTSPCFSGVILAGCGWCSLPLPSSHQGLVQPAAPFLDSCLSQFAASKSNMFRGEPHRNGPYLYSKWSWCCTASLASAFVSSDPVSYCWPATEGKVARVPIHFIQCCLTPRLCTGLFSLWQHLKTRVRVV